MDFGEAIRRMRDGQRVARAGWNGRGMWLCLVTTAAYGMLPLDPFIAMKTVQHTMVPWLASQTDMLAQDWEEVP